jgi:hypothetical protein
VKEAAEMPLKVDAMEWQQAGRNKRKISPPNNNNNKNPTSNAITTAIKKRKSALGTIFI